MFHVKHLLSNPSSPNQDDVCTHVPLPSFLYSHACIDEQAQAIVDRAPVLLVFLPDRTTFLHSSLASNTAQAVIVVQVLTLVSAC